MCLCVTVVTAHILHFCQILGPNLFCCVPFLTYGCIFTTTNRRSSKVWLTLKVSGKLHPEDVYVKTGFHKPLMQIQQNKKDRNNLKLSVIRSDNGWSHSRSTFNSGDAKVAVTTSWPIGGSLHVNDGNSDNAQLATTQLKRWRVAHRK